MKLKSKIEIAKLLLAAKLLKRYRPILIGWAVTSRCNSRCLYCDCWKMKNEDLTSVVMTKMIDQFGVLKTKFISITGGEPLLREDIGYLINYCKNKGIYTKLNTNGILLGNRIDEVKNADLFSLSLDGTETSNDFVRGKGAFRKAIAAADLLKKHNLKLAFSATISKYNLNDIDFLIDLAREYKASVSFQPATLKVLYGERENAVIASDSEHKEFIRLLIERKKGRGKAIVSNSLLCLKALANWPKPHRIKCASGRISCRIDSNGDIWICNRISKTANFNCLDLGVGRAFDLLPKIFCNECYCAQRVEANLLYSLKPSVIFSKAFSL